MLEKYYIHGTYLMKIECDVMFEKLIVILFEVSYAKMHQYHLLYELHCYGIWRVLYIDNFTPPNGEIDLS